MTFLCEYLPRLQTLSILLQFNDTLHDISDLRISQGKLLVKSKSHDNCLPLPIEVNKFSLTNIKLVSGYLFVNLKVETNNDDLSVINSQLWSSKYLLKTPKNAHNVNEFTFNCINCNQEIINSCHLKIFDLPSELWTEMMDFWHCHKPHTESSETTKSRYEGNLKPSPGSMLIGNDYFLIHSENAGGLTNDNHNEYCGGCKKVLGNYTPKSIKLQKWNLSLNFAKETEHYPSYLYVYNLILDKINLSALRKLKINDYIIWIFNIGINISLDVGIYSNCLKILYYKGDDPSIDSVTIDDSIMSEVLKELNKIHKALPSTSNKLSMNEDNEVKVYNISYLGMNRDV